MHAWGHDRGEDHEGLKEEEGKQRESGDRAHDRTEHEPVGFLCSACQFDGHPEMDGFSINFKLLDRNSVKINHFDENRSKSMG